MNLSTLTKIKARSKKRLGMGHGGGRGKTSGRGTKGQKARRNIALSFEGGALPLIKRMPFRRGKGKNYSLNMVPVVVNVGSLNELPKGSVVDVKLLAQHKFATEKEMKERGIKILGHGDLQIALTVALPVSASAKEKIEKAGGNVTL
ncbi:MAG TPA: 50S ribosomal protein L15 [Patescibacteria group bacterium]|nr:50S ribosomal protein L15 [Patescibacteria group bacterium]